MRKDQPSLRELLWESDLRIATLPPEYNLLDLGAIRRWDRFRPAPRLIHHYRFHKHFTGRRREVATVEDLLGPMTAARLPMILAADRGLARLAGREPREPTPRRPRRRLRRRPRRPAALGRRPRRLRPPPPRGRPMTEPFRVLTCADADYFHFLPYFEANVRAQVRHAAADLRPRPDGRAARGAALRGASASPVPADYKDHEPTHGFIMTTHKPACVADALDREPGRRPLRRRRRAVRRAGRPPPTSAAPTSPSRPRIARERRPDYLANGALNAGVALLRRHPGRPGAWSPPGPRPAPRAAAPTRRRSPTSSPASTCSDRLGPETRGRPDRLMKLDPRTFNDTRLKTGRVLHFKNAGRDPRVTASSTAFRRLEERHPRALAA